MEIAAVVYVSICCLVGAVICKPIASVPGLPTTPRPFPSGAERGGRETGPEVIALQDARLDALCQGEYRELSELNTILSQVEIDIYLGRLN
jgi:hypothetical protein